MTDCSYLQILHFLGFFKLVKYKNNKPNVENNVLHVYTDVGNHVTKNRAASEKICKVPPPRKMELNSGFICFSHFLGPLWFLV